MAEPPQTVQKPLTEIAENPRYQRLVRERSRFGWTLTIIMLAIFFGYILLIAFAPEFLAQRVSGTMTLGIPIGIGVIVAGVVLTGIYVHRANTRFDAMTREIVGESLR